MSHLQNPGLHFANVRYMLTMMPILLDRLSDRAEEFGNSTDCRKVQRSLILSKLATLGHQILKFDPEGTQRGLARNISMDESNLSRKLPVLEHELLSDFFEFAESHGVKGRICTERAVSNSDFAAMGLIYNKVVFEEDDPIARSEYATWDTCKSIFSTLENATIATGEAIVKQHCYLVKWVSHDKGVQLPVGFINALECNDVILVPYVISIKQNPEFDRLPHLVVTRKICKDLMPHFLGKRIVMELAIQSDVCAKKMDGFGSALSRFNLRLMAVDVPYHWMRGTGNFEMFPFTLVVSVPLNYDNEFLSSSEYRTIVDSIEQIYAVEHGDCLPDGRDSDAPNHRRVRKRKKLFNELRDYPGPMGPRLLDSQQVEMELGMEVHNRGSMDELRAFELELNLQNE